MAHDAMPISVWTIEQLLLDASKRGIDSTGVALQYHDGRVEVCKAAMVAWEFVRNRVWGDFVDQHRGDDHAYFHDDVVAVLGHARKGSKGGAWKNENNHPVYSGITAVTHNGGIHNHEQLFKDFKLKRDAEVDTDIIRAVLDERGLGTPGAVEWLNRMNGPAAIAAVSSREPGRMLLARSGSPLAIGAQKDTNHLVWSSRKEGIHKISRPYFRLFGIETFQANSAGNLLFCPVPGETLWMFEEEKVKLAGGKEGWTCRMTRTFPFRSNNGQDHNLQYHCHDSHPAAKKEVREKQAAESVKEIKEARREMPGGMGVQAVGEVTGENLLVECPSKCGVFLDFDKKDWGVELAEFCCPECGTQLGGVGA